MDKKLLFQTITKLLIGMLLIALLIFIPANTINFWNGWLLMGLLFIPITLVGIIMLFKAPDLLRKRLKTKETEKEQKAVVLYSGIMFLAGFIIAGLNYRYNWIPLPNCIVTIASILFIISYILYAEVLRENAYLSRTIEVQENQKVVDTGLYGIVRHPMYSATILMFLSMPLILGSLISFIIFLIYPIIIAKRIKNEEQVLEKDLQGYSEYKKKVKYRLIPFIWWKLNIILKGANTKMKLKVLLDNNTYIDEYYLAEPAVSYYIEDEENKILFDTGYSDIFIKNAKKMNINLENLNKLVISHGHNDHTGGLEHFIKNYTK